MDIKHMKDSKNVEILQLVDNCKNEIDILLEKSIKRIKRDNIEIANYKRMNENPNLACAILYYEGKKEMYIAHSSINIIKNLVYLQNISLQVKAVATSLPNVFGRKQIFNTKELNCTNNELKVPYDRKVDTEAKIIEYIANDFGENILNGNKKWKLIIWTHLYPCPSCRCVARAFEKCYSNIEITILYSERNLKNPCDIGDGCDGDI